QGLYQKAETLYSMGDFEFALVFYHRGYKLRPELHKFWVGIEKCQEAIVNCVGSPSSVQLRTKGEVCFISRQAESRIANQKVAMRLPKACPRRQTVRKPRTERQLLGELYADKIYLEKLLKDKDLMSSRLKEGVSVGELVRRCLSYLGTRREFWQQQKPIYARLRERRLRQRSSTRDKQQKPLDVGKYIDKNVEDLEILLAGDDPKESCRKAQLMLKTVQEWSDDEVPNKNELLGYLHSCIGTAQLDMGRLEAALQSHSRDLECARRGDLPEAVSRALDNMGTVYARMGKFQQAVDSWEERIPMTTCSLEKTCLFHEIGRCYLELDKAQEAQSYGEKSLQAAEEAGDVEWQLHTTVLVAQAQVQLKNFQAAILTFEKALEKARFIHDEVAGMAIV
ncbi:TTC25 protein, partial [Turnix velox]|nr:TTC25 protein [Turnix velox]